MASNIDRWMDVYAIKLTEAVIKHPEDYFYGPDGVPQVCDRMRRAFEADSYNLDSHAINNTARHFGIKPTRKAIREFITQTESV